MLSTKGHIPIYKKLTDFYIDQIYKQKYVPGSRIDSINKIMSRHKVSRETAKLVIRKLIEQGLVISKPGKGTFVNVRAITQKIWGVVVPFFSSNTEQLISELDHLASNVQRDLKYYLHYNNHNEEIKITGSLIQEGYEAIIVVPNYNETLTADYYRRLITGNTRLILADNTMAGSHFAFVIQSYDLGVKRATNYLASRNSGNFVLLGNEIWKGQNMVFELMENTFRSILEEQFPDRKLFVKSRINELNLDFVRKNDIVGILCVQDSDSIRIIGRMQDWGINIPDEISIVSYGNTELTQYFKPSITAIDCNYSEMAKSISEYILDNNNPHKEQVLIPPKLIIRET